MTPLDMEILICYAATRRDYRNGDFSAPAVREAIDNLIKKNILYGAATTKGGAVYAMPDEVAIVVRTFIASIQLPEPEWKMVVQGERLDDWKVNIT